MSRYLQTTAAQLTSYRLLPKVELHRHLEGALRLSTLREIAAQHQLALPAGDLRAQVQMQPGDPLTYAHFLSKFQTLRLFYRSPEVIARLTQEAVADAAQDGVAYLELRFSPVALSRLQQFPLAEVMDWVAAAAADAARDCHLPTRLIASVNRHEPVALAEAVARLAVERLEQGIVGLDLAGNEVDFSALPFAGVFREARQSGLRITVHAGEWGGAQNVREAILELGAERIGHGVRILEDPAVVALARERGVTLEVCPTSNVLSGVFPALTAHPLARLVEQGLRVSLNTDDPSIQDTCLSAEYQLAVAELGLTPAALGGCIRAAARAAFLPQLEAAALEQRLCQRLDLALTG